MTGIAGHLASSRRAGELGVHSLDHFALSVPDLTTARAFYTTFGLDLRTDGNVMGIHTFGHPQRWGMLIEGETKRLHHLSFGVFEDDLERFEQRIERQGIRRLDPPPGFANSHGLWIHDPDGT